MMGISLKDSRRRRRRNASNSRASRPRRRSGNDPFRIIFYLVVIAAGVWTYFNQDAVKTWFRSELEIPEAADRTGQAPDTGSPSGTQSPLDPLDFGAEAEMAYQDGYIPEAIDYYRQAVEDNPGNVYYQVQIARLLLFESALQYGEEREATLEEALEAANMATLIDPFDASGYSIKGKILDWQGSPQQAVNALNEALGIDPDYALAYSYLAEAYVDLDQWDQALETIERVLEMRPDHVDVRRDYAYVLEYLGYYNDAALQYEAALTLHNGLAYIHLALGRVYNVLGRYDDALDQFYLVQASRPSMPLVIFEIGRTYETYIGDPNTALENYEQAVGIDADFGLGWLRIGTLYFYQERYGQAASMLEKALELGAESNDMYYQLGLAYAYEGNCGSALRYLNEAQARAGDDERIQEAVRIGFDLCSEPADQP